MSKICKVCGVEIPPKRLEILPHTQTCTKHSVAEKKVGMIVTLGEGDHTYNELSILEAEDYKRIQKSLRTTRGDSEFGL